VTDAVKGILAILTTIALGAIGCWYIRRREKREAARFGETYHMEGADYVAAMGYKAGTHEAEAALKFRGVIAKLGEIPPESVLPEHKFGEYDGLPFFDSSDCIHLIMTIEEGFGIQVPNEVADGIVRDVFDNFRYDRDFTVKEMTDKFMVILQGLEKKDGRREK
jgi:acyl carrier protein